MSNPISSGYVRGGGNTGRWQKNEAGLLPLVSVEFQGQSLPVPQPLASTLTSREVAQGQGFTGDQCSNCQSMRMQIAGHCMVCADCGTTTGCS